MPVFADIDPLTTTLDPADVERKITPRTKAIMVVHWKGIPADMDAIMDIAHRRCLKVVEDNAVSQGTTHRGRMLGSIGDASAISFQDGKLTSAGEGGVFMTDSDEVFQRAATLGHYERLKNLPDPKWRAVSGFSFGEKYRMATITAAIGAVQMKHWRKRLDVRHDNAAKLGRAVAEIDGFSAPDYPDYFPSPYLSGRILFHPDRLGGITRESLIEVLNAEGARVTSPARKDSRIPHTDGLRRMLHKHPVFVGNEHGTEDILWEVLGANATKIDYKSVVLPVTEDPEVPYDTIELPSFTRPADDLIDPVRKGLRQGSHTRPQACSSRRMIDFHTHVGNGRTIDTIRRHVDAHGGGISVLLPLEPGPSSAAGDSDSMSTQVAIRSARVLPGRDRRVLPRRPASVPMRPSAFTPSVKPVS